MSGSIPRSRSAFARAARSISKSILAPLAREELANHARRSESRRLGREHNSPPSPSRHARGASLFEQAPETSRLACHGRQNTFYRAKVGTHHCRSICVRYLDRGGKTSAQPTAESNPQLCKQQGGAPILTLGFPSSQLGAVSLAASSLVGVTTWVTSQLRSSLGGFRLNARRRSRGETSDLSRDGRWRSRSGHTLGRKASHLQKTT